MADSVMAIEARARSGEVLFVGDLVKVANGIILRRVTGADVGMETIPGPDICIWDGEKALPFQEAMRQIYEVQGQSRDDLVSRAPFPEAAGVFKIVDFCGAPRRR